MKVISLDASTWRSAQDFYNAVLPELGAPKQHGTNINALVESMVWGGINKLDPPYKIEIMNTGSLPTCVMDEIRAIADFTIESRAEFLARKGRDVQVSFEILS